MRTLIGVALTVFLLACASTPKASSVEPELLTDEAKLVSQELGQVVFRFPWELENATTAPASVVGARWSLTLDGGEPATGTDDTNATAPGGGKTTGKIEVGFPVEVSAEAFVARTEVTAWKYTMTATFDIKTGGEVVEYEAEWNGEIFPPKLPEVTLEGQAGRYGDGALELNFQVMITNVNPFTVQIGGLDYKLFVKDKDVATGKLAHDQPLNGASELQFNVARFLGKDDNYDLAKELLKADVIPYRFEGELTAGGIMVTVPIEGEIEFGQ